MRFGIMEYELTIKMPRPYFEEMPYYMWGTVNYDSEGDCKRPTDTEWTFLELTNRETKETLEITSREDALGVDALGVGLELLYPYFTLYMLKSHTNCYLTHQTGDLYDIL